jgi:hypothetical protein
VLVVGAALWVQLPIHDRTAVPMDEGHLAAAASRLLEGEVLYRDVHTGIAPLIYYGAALLFRLLGPDLLVTRFAQVAVNLAIALLLWVLALRVARAHWAALAPALYLLVLAVAFPVLSMLNYSSVALGLALASLLLLLVHCERGTVASGAALGTLLAATALTKQNYGALCIVATGITLAWNRPRAEGARSLGRLAAPVVLSGAFVALLSSGYFASRGAFFDLVDSTMLSIGGPQLESFDNPIPPLLGEHPRDDGRFIFLYTPPTLFNHILHGGKLFGAPVTHFARELAIRVSYGLPLLALLAAPVALWLTRRRARPEAQREARAIALFAALFFLGIFPSAIWSHLAFVVAPAFLALVIACDRIEGLRRPRGGARFVGPALALGLCVAAVAAAARTASTAHTWFPKPLDLPRARLFVTPNFEKLYHGALRFIDGCAPPGAAIFVAPDLPILYFLADRVNPTPYDLTIPGNVDEDVIVDRLEADGTRCVVYNPRMYPEFPPFAELFPGLDHYLETHYEPAQVIRGEGGEWLGLVRKEAPPQGHAAEAPATH